MQLRARNDIHLARRIWHFCGVMFIFALYSRLAPKQALITATVVSVALIALDIGRLYVPMLNRRLTWIFKPILRSSELHRVTGATAMLIGVTIIIYIFPKPVVMLSLLFVAVADPLASYFGVRFGRDKLVGEKSVQGTSAAFVACFFLALGYCFAMDLMTERLFIVSLLAALIGAASELVPVGRLDDNFVFPVLSATLLTGLFYVFGGL